MSIRGGWVWNLWGRDCVVVQLNKGTLRIGTDDAANLAVFLQGKVGG
jgi:polygalacturonase